MPQMIHLTATSNNENCEAPRSATVSVDADLAQKIRTLAAIATTQLAGHFGNYITVFSYEPEWTCAPVPAEHDEVDESEWDDIREKDQDLRTDVDCLHVGATDFWFSAVLKHTDIEISSGRFSVAALDDALIHALAMDDVDHEQSTAPAP